MNDQLLEKGFESVEGGVFFNGKIRALFESGDEDEDGEDCNDTSSISINKAGRIEQWWITGMTEGETPSVGITTALGDYYLQKPTKT